MVMQECGTCILQGLSLPPYCCLTGLHLSQYFFLLQSLGKILPYYFICLFESLVDLCLVKRWMCCDKAQLLTSFEKFFKDVLLFRVLKSDKIQIQNLSERPKISLALPKRLSTYLKNKNKTKQWTRK